MKCFVTGGTGFVGSHLVRHLEEEGHEVVAFHRAGSDLSQLEGTRATRRVGSLISSVDLEKAMEGCDVVFHVAGNTSWFLRDRSVVIEANVRGTEAVVEAMQRTGIVRGVITSSVSATGFTDDIGHPADETTSFNWPEPFHYPSSKRQAEKIFLEAAGLQTVAVLPTVVLGPGDARLGIGEMFQRIAWRQMPRLGRGGVSTCDARDVARGHRLALERGRPGEGYILCGENIPYGELIDRIAEEVGVVSPRLQVPGMLVGGLARVMYLLERLGVSVPTAGGHIWCMTRTLYHSPRKAEEELGYRSRPLAETLAESVRWYQDHGHFDRSR